MPVLCGVMRTLRRRETPADAPAVRKISSGSQGYPSRSKFILEKERERERGD